VSLRGGGGEREKKREKARAEPTCQAHAPFFAGGGDLVFLPSEDKKKRKEGTLACSPGNTFVDRGKRRGKKGEGWPDSRGANYP